MRSPPQVNNFLGVLAIDRNVSGTAYRLHIGFAATYYVTLRDTFLAKLKAALAQHPGDVYLSGHSRGGAMAAVAAFDLVGETAAQVGREGTPRACSWGAALQSHERPTAQRCAGGHH